MKSQKQKTAMRTKRRKETSVKYNYGKGETSKSSSFKIIKLPLKSLTSDFSLNNLEKDSISKSGLFCGVLNHITENIFSLGNNAELVKCRSFETKIRFSNKEISANFPFTNPFGASTASCPFDFRNDNNSFLTFSSNKNLNLLSFDSDNNIVSPLCYYAGVMQSSLNMFFSKGRGECCKNFFYRHTSLKHFQNLPDHNSSAFESWYSSADCCVCINIFSNSDSHNQQRDNYIYKDLYFSNMENSVECVFHSNRQELRVLECAQDVVHILTSPDREFDTKRSPINQIPCNLNKGEL